MRILNEAETHMCSGASIEYNTLANLYKTNSPGKVGDIGLASASEEKRVDMKEYNPGDAGYYYTTGDDGVITKYTWFKDLANGLFLNAQTIVAIV